MNQDKFDLLKSHIDAYTRKDGTVVAAHDDKRVNAGPKPGHFEVSTGKTGADHHQELAMRHKYEAINAGDPKARGNHQLGEKLHKYAAANPKDSMARETANNFSNHLSSGSLTDDKVSKAKQYYRYRQ